MLESAVNACPEVLLDAAALLYAMLCSIKHVANTIVKTPSTRASVLQSALNVSNEPSTFVLLQSSWHAHIRRCLT